VAARRRLPPARQIGYGDHADQVGNLHLPDGEPAVDGAWPAVVLIHGGFWRYGWDRTLMTPLARDLAERGIAAWNIEYRRVGQEGGGWPGTLGDAAAASDAVVGLEGEQLHTPRDLAYNPRRPGELWVVNLLCGAIFTWGLMRFAEAQQRPWLAIVVAIPYLVIVVAMGYTRQAVAIGLIMAGLANYTRTGSMLRFAIYVAVAATFHKTAVVALPLIALANERGRFAGLLIAVAATYLFYQFFLSASVGRLVTNYIDARYAAEGAGIRVAMSVLPAGLFLLRSRSLGYTEQERRVWRNLSIAAFVFLFLLIVVRSSAAVDRLALYTIPLQAAVLSRPRSVFASEGFGRFLVIAYAAVVQFTWLTYAHHSRFWVPYQVWPFAS